MVQLLLKFNTLTCHVQVINKVAGIYGLVAVFTGGSLVQLSMYIYSVALLFVFVWGIRVTSAVSPHLFKPENLEHAFPATRESPSMRLCTRRVSLRIFRR